MSEAPKLAIPPGWIATSMFGAGAEQNAHAFGERCAAYATAHLRVVAPIAVLTFEPGVAREVMASGNQPEATIAAIEKMLADNPAWVFFEFVFAAPAARVSTNPLSIVGGPAGRWQ